MSNSNDIKTLLAHQVANALMRNANSTEELHQSLQNDIENGDLSQIHAGIQEALEVQAKLTEAALNNPEKFAQAIAKLA